MRLSLSCFAFITASCILSSCEDSHKTKKEGRFEKDNYFSGSTITLSLDELKNEMVDSRTDYLKSFATDQIPWQKWDQSLLEKDPTSRLGICW
jgi:plasmid replication initiation protein